MGVGEGEVVVWSAFIFMADEPQRFVEAVAFGNLVEEVEGGLVEGLTVGEISISAEGDDAFIDQLTVFSAVSPCLLSVGLVEFLAKAVLLNGLTEQGGVKFFFFRIGIAWRAATKVVVDSSCNIGGFLHPD